MTYRTAKCFVAQSQELHLVGASTARPAFMANQRMLATSARPFASEPWLAEQTAGSRALTMHSIGELAIALLK
jgi:hypothetical protein